MRLPLSGAVVYSILLILSLRTGTITNQDEITVRGFLGTKKISWPDIQDIRVEENPVGRVETDYTKAAPAVSSCQAAGLAS